MKIRARHFATEEAIEIAADGPTINSITPVDCSPEGCEQLPWVSPGLFDIQINGYNGVWFSSPSLTVNEIVDTTQALVNTGIARFFPTLITASFEALHHGFTRLREACESNSLVSSCVEGYHLEGPYISAEDGPRGAHPIQHVRSANIEEFRKLQEASGNRIRMVTLAAEADNAVEFIEHCRHHDVLVAIGHTGASPDQIRAAIEAGAQLSTHFGNGAHSMLPRHPNYLWEQLADDRLWASVIADGWHVPESVLQCVLKCKTLQRTILTCDVSGFAGCPPGTYTEGDIAVDVLEDGRVVVAGQREFLAGSGAVTGDCIAQIISSCGVSLRDAVAMATVNPAHLLQLDAPTLDIGQPATLSVFRIQATNSQVKSSFVPVDTYVHGEKVSVSEKSVS